MKEHIVKSRIPRFIASAILGLATATTLVVAAPAGGYIDLSKFGLTEAGGEIVDVTIGSNLISMATRLTQMAEPEVSSVLKGLELIQVKVVGLKKANQNVIAEKVQSIRDELDAIGWERIVSSKKDGEDVAIYIKTKGDESIHGLVVSVLQAKREAVLVNIVGEIRPEQLAMVGERFNIEPLKKVGRQVEGK